MGGWEGEIEESRGLSRCWALFAWIGDRVLKLERTEASKGGKMVSASKEMAVYCFDTLVAHYTGDMPPPPGFEEGQL